MQVNLKSSTQHYAQYESEDEKMQVRVRVMRELTPHQQDEKTLTVTVK